MIIFFSVPVIFIVLAFIVILFGGVQIITALLPFLTGFFIIKNLIIDVGFGMFKNENSGLRTLAYVVIDIARTVTFFNTLTAIANRSGFFSVFDFALAFFLGGILYLGGELVAVGHGLSEDESNDKLSGSIAVDLFFLGLLYLLTRFF